MMFTRRSLLQSSAALLAATAIGCTTVPGAGARNFVRRDGTRFRIGADTYRYAGANIWYGAYLGADAAFGNRDRLRR